MISIVRPYVFHTPENRFNIGITNRIVMDNDRISLHSQSCGQNQQNSNFRKNQKVRRRSEKCSNFRNFPDFSEDLTTLGVTDNT
jgi:hypothetical protein